MKYFTPDVADVDRSSAPTGDRDFLVSHFEAGGTVSTISGQNGCSREMRLSTYKCLDFQMAELDEGGVKSRDTDKLIGGANHQTDPSGDVSSAGTLSKKAILSTGPSSCGDLMSEIVCKNLRDIPIKSASWLSNDAVNTVAHHLLKAPEVSDVTARDSAALWSFEVESRTNRHDTEVTCSAKLRPSAPSAITPGQEPYSSPSTLQEVTWGVRLAASGWECLAAEAERKQREGLLGGSERVRGARWFLQSLGSGFGR